MEKQFESDFDFLIFFFNEEIRGSNNVIDYYLDFLYDEKRNEVSGDALYIEKKGESLIFGNLFDDDFSEVEISRGVFENFLIKKKG